jgi:hypothetical protein
MLEANICSTEQIAKSWGILGEVAEHRVVEREEDNGPEAPAAQPPPFVPAKQRGVGAVIEDALRSAGLMR